MKQFNHRLVARILGTLMLMVATIMVLPIAVAWHKSDGSLQCLSLSCAIITTVGLSLRYIIGRGARYELHERESFWVTAAVWIILPLFGALPYLLSGQFHSFTDAAFESVSGFTTTGSSIVPNPSALSAGLLLWRALTQWLGGLGLVLLAVAFMKRLQVGSLRLYDAEFSGTQQRKLHPRIAKSVGRMWRIYAFITLVLIALLIWLGNRPIESVCLALSTVSTGGFMTAADGLATFSTPTIYLLSLFMFLSGINIALLYNLFTFRWRQLKRTEELSLYLIVFFLSVVGCTLAFVLRGNDWDQSAQYSLFHIASTISTCGFYTQPPSNWPFLASVLTFLLLISGAMAGSTGGGLKLRRLMTLARYLRNYFTRMLHPNAVFAVKIDHRAVPSDYVNKTFSFVFLYICCIIAGAFALTLCGCGISEAFCLAAANIGNLGPSPLINSMGANLEYSLLPTAAKWVLMLLMLAGRLEIFALLSIVSPSYWKRR